ncbi:MAG: AMP-binding protein, partial [Treponema sp.]|nr:AMP-binding protein [Treponema sp.]
MSVGGVFPSKLDKFFNSIGIKILEAYGLTETAPMVAMRERYNPVMGTIGKPMPYLDVKLVKEDKTLAKPGEKGILFVKG